MSETDINYRGGQGQVLDPETFRDSVGTMEQSCGRYAGSAAGEPAPELYGRR